jgi:glycosyltransferase involved in cell wall biosynthesis
VRALRVALVGSRGIPGRYGGYETLFAELAPRLVERGFDVTVYCRSTSVRAGDRTTTGASRRAPVRRTRYAGARLVHLPTIRTKHLDTPVHTLLSCLHAAGERFDAALVVNSANALFLPLLSAAGTPSVLNVDGIEKRRAKWGAFGRAVFALSERLACFLPDQLVTDAEVIRGHYLARYAANSSVVTYGVDARPLWQSGVLRRLGLEKRGYFLYVSRFEPENNPHRVVAGYAGVGGEVPLVMVGGAPYANEYIASFRPTADPRVRFPGPIYGRGYRQLLSHAMVYIHATEVGGTHPALVEAMGYGNCLVVNDTPENREVAGDVALYFRADAPATLAALLERLRADPQEVARRGRAAAARAVERFNWEEIADRYAGLLRAASGMAPETAPGGVSGSAAMDASAATRPAGRARGIG